MEKRCCNFKQVTILSLVALFCMGSAPPVIAQHEGHTMPGMRRSKPKPKTAPKRKAKRQTKRKSAARVPKSAKPTNIPTTPGHTEHTPGTVITSPIMTPAPTRDPQRGPARVETGSPHTHTPGMPKPASSPTTNEAVLPAQHDTHTLKPGTTPSPPPEKTDLDKPTAHPSPDPAKQSHDSMEHSKGEAKPAESMTGTDTTTGHVMNMGPLMVMSGDDMSIRVGASKTNVMPMGQMGSGTSWQPASTTHEHAAQNFRRLVVDVSLQRRRRR